MRFIRKHKPGYVERYSKAVTRNKEQFAAFVKERREVLLSMDADRIRDFLRRHGEEESSLMMNEPMLAAACYGIIVDIGLDEEQKAKAKEWLKANGWKIDEEGVLRKLPQTPE